MLLSGYYRFPTINKNTIVFVCEDDLWKVDKGGGTAERLTAGLGATSFPIISPNGEYIAFVGSEEGNGEIYVMGINGGSVKRLTYQSGVLQPIGWTNDSQNIIYSTNAKQPFLKLACIYTVNRDGGNPEKLPLGHARHISYGSGGRSVIGRHTNYNIARWKRYKGGRTGALWVDGKGDGEYKEYKSPNNGNINSPMWVGERIYFIADHEGMGNIYSINPDMQDLQKHTDVQEYFISYAIDSEQIITYQSGGDIYLLDTETGSNEKLEIQYPGTRTQSQRKFVDAASYLHTYSIHPQGHSFTVNTRSKSYSAALWEGAVKPIANDADRTILTQYLPSGNGFVTVADRNGKETIEIHKDGEYKRFDNIELGGVLKLKVSPDETFIIATTHDYNIHIINIEKETSEVIERSPFNRIGGFDISADSKWVAVATQDSHHTSSIKVYNVASKELTQITSSDFHDHQPSFDPDGKFIYFISERALDPVYDSIYFDLNFPQSAKPYLVALTKDVESPFIPKPKTPEENGFGDHNRKKRKKEPVEVKIDFDGIKNRVLAFPVKEQLYEKIVGLQGRVVFQCKQAKGALNNTWQSTSPPKESQLMVYDFDMQRQATIATEVSSFHVSSKSETIIYRSGNRLRAVPSVPPPNNRKQNNKIGRTSGWLDLKRFKVSIVPQEEWLQMFGEIWRLQKQHFWVKNMSGVDWQRIYDRYLPLIKRASARREFSDIIWEMQGELGTSHAYEIGGDHRKSPNYHQGLLGADFEWDENEKAYKIAHIVQGDSWLDIETSSLSRLSVNAKVGDYILSVNGETPTKQLPPEAFLVSNVQNEVEVTLKQEGEMVTQTIKTLGNDLKARYREWVENNRKYVHEKTGDKVGYVHVPNMGPWGYAEFHRYYNAEVNKGGLIVDVRFNGGGHVSQLLLEKLARKAINFKVSRWGSTMAYPRHTVQGPILAITDECSGSDGDIFSHNFKLMGIGTLVGKRTWGGVIGIWPRHRLADNTIVTQPEFSSYFTDVKWQVENYGTDPDVDVDITPMDWKNGVDSQMDKSIELILKQMKEQPFELPKFDDKPDLSLPT